MRICDRQGTSLGTWTWHHVLGLNVNNRRGLGDIGFDNGQGVIVILYLFGFHLFGGGEEP